MVSTVWHGILMECTQLQDTLFVDHTDSRGCFRFAFCCLDCMLKGRLTISKHFCYVSMQHPKIVGLLLRLFFKVLVSILCTRYGSKGKTSARTDAHYCCFIIPEDALVGINVVAHSTATIRNIANMFDNW
eukprot:scaffold39854_cov53-Attheya_sp.AAC.1